MHLRILPDHQNQVIKKLFFSPLEWLKTCFDAFPDFQNQVLKKIFFSPLEWLKTYFYAFPGQQNQVPKKLIFHVWGGQKRVFMHFLATRTKSLKIYFFTSGVVKNVFLCICTYFQTTRIK
jgi:hypothetical protein